MSLASPLLTTSLSKKRGREGKLPSSPGCSARANQIHPPKLQLHSVGGSNRRCGPARPAHLSLSPLASFSQRHASSLLGPGITSRALRASSHLLLRLLQRRYCGPLLARPDQQSRLRPRNRERTTSTDGGGGGGVTAAQPIAQSGYLTPSSNRYPR